MSEHTFESINTRTPSETLMKVMQDFSDEEPLAVMVIWITEKGSTAFESSTTHRTINRGLLEQVRDRFQALGFEQWREDK
jgi:heme-degrading monooxygenase HmoA